MRARVKRLHTQVLVLVGAPKASIGFPVPGITNRRRGDNYCFEKEKWTERVAQVGSFPWVHGPRAEGAAGLVSRW